MTLRVRRLCCRTQGEVTPRSGPLRYRWVVTDSNGALVYASAPDETLIETKHSAANMRGVPIEAVVFEGP